VFAFVFKVLQLFSGFVTVGSATLWPVEKSVSQLFTIDYNHYIITNTLLHYNLWDMGSSGLKLEK